jgi:hypothetical protein
VGQQEAVTEEIETRPSKHLALQHLVVYRQRAGNEWALLPVGQRAYNPPFSQSRIGRSLPHEACRGGLQTKDALCGSPSSTLPSF